MQQEFRDTVKFTLKPGLAKAQAERALGDIRRISGVFALQASVDPAIFEVLLDDTVPATAIGHQIAQNDAVWSTTITPAEFHALTAKIAAGQKPADLRP